MRRQGNWFVIRKFISPRIFVRLGGKTHPGIVSNFFFLLILRIVKSIHNGQVAVTNEAFRFVCSISGNWIQRLWVHIKVHRCRYPDPMKSI